MTVLAARYNTHRAEFSARKKWEGLGPSWTCKLRNHEKFSEEVGSFTTSVSTGAKIDDSEHCSRAELLATHVKGLETLHSTS